MSLQVSPGNLATPTASLEPLLVASVASSNWLRRWLRKAVPQSAGEALIMAAALVLVLVVLMATLAAR